MGNKGPACATDEEHLTSVFPLWFSHDGQKSSHNFPKPKNPLTPIGSCRDLHINVYIYRYIVYISSIFLPLTRIGPWPGYTKKSQTTPSAGPFPLDGAITKVLTRPGGQGTSQEKKIESSLHTWSGPMYKPFYILAGRRAYIYIYIYMLPRDKNLPIGVSPPTHAHTQKRNTSQKRSQDDPRKIPKWWKSDPQTTSTRSQHHPQTVPARYAQRPKTIPTPSQTDPKVTQN